MVAAQFPGTTARPNTMAIVARPQPQAVRGEGFAVRSVDHDTGSNAWAVDFQAGGRMYRYYTDHAAQKLQVCDGAQFTTISTGPQTPLAVESVLQNMAGLGIPFGVFRAMYEQWFYGFVSGWCAADESSRAGLDF